MFDLNEKDFLNVFGGEGVCKCKVNGNLVGEDQANSIGECKKHCCAFGCGRITWIFEGEDYTDEQGICRKVC